MRYLSYEDAVEILTKHSEKNWFSRKWIELFNSEKSELLMEASIVLIKQTALIEECILGDKDE